MSKAHYPSLPRALLRRVPFSLTMTTILRLFAVAIVCLFFADIEIASTSPWVVLERLFIGALTPSYPSLVELLNAILLTVQFAVVGVMIGVIAGFGLAGLYRIQAVRWFCALIRAVHELFWALLLIAFIGLSPEAGLLAIAIPYAGIFAKVFHEMLLQVDPVPGMVLQDKAGFVPRFFYGKFSQVAPKMAHYTSYRLECALRSSAVLGFVGLPTLGYYLESALKEGRYSEVWLLIYVLLVLIGTKKWWFNRHTWLGLLILSSLSFPFSGSVSFQHIGQFFSDELVPAPLRSDEAGFNYATFESAAIWFRTLWIEEIFPGTINTFLLTMLSLMATGLCVVLLLPIQSKWFLVKPVRYIGRAGILFVRSLPEVILAFIVMLLVGPSMLPAVAALAIHNGGVIAHLLQHQMENLSLREDHTKGILLYGYEILPRVSAQFMSFWLYRWEVIMRETAILGLLGIPTLGFFIDSAFEDIRYDRAALLILSAAVLNIAIELVSGRLQLALSARKTQESCIKEDAPVAS